MNGRGPNFPLSYPLILTANLWLYGIAERRIPHSWRGLYILGRFGPTRFWLNAIGNFQIFNSIQLESGRYQLVHKTEIRVEGPINTQTNTFISYEGAWNFETTLYHELDIPNYAVPYKVIQRLDLSVNHSLA